MACPGRSKRTETISDNFGSATGAAAIAAGPISGRAVGPTSAICPSEFVCPPRIEIAQTTSSAIDAAINAGFT